jgi:hypothetical protein
MGARTKLTSVLIAVAQRQLENSAFAAVGSDLTSDTARDLAAQVRGTVDGARAVATIAAETPAKARRAVKAARLGLALARAINKSGAVP